MRSNQLCLFCIAWSFLMASYKAKLGSNGNKASHCFNSKYVRRMHASLNFNIGLILIHFYWPNSFVGVPNSMSISCKTLHQTESQAYVLSVCSTILSQKCGKLRICDSSWSVTSKYTTIPSNFIYIYSKSREKKVGCYFVCCSLEWCATAVTTDYFITILKADTKINISRNNQESIIKLTQLSFYYKLIYVFTFCYKF